MIKYIKAAFTNKWNLLAFLGGMGFAFISGRPDIVAPVVLAAEIAYLGLLGTHPKFQKYVNAQEAKSQRQARSQTNEQILNSIRHGLPRELLNRYKNLRARCLELRQIASDLKQPGLDQHGSSLDSMQVAGLDRLLWVYLRLLFTKHSLQRFFNNTSLENIRRDRQRVEEQLSSLDQKAETPHTEKMRRALQDNLKTMEDRIRNYERAQANHDFVYLEIDRLENKITSLAELAVNRQEPDFISSQVDQVAESMLETEKTMNDLEFVTGFRQVDEEAPHLLEEVYHITE